MVSSLFPSGVPVYFLPSRQELITFIDFSYPSHSDIVVMTSHHTIQALKEHPVHSPNEQIQNLRFVLNFSVSFGSLVEQRICAASTASLCAESMTSTLSV
jgi:hypothetical protein